MTPDKTTPAQMMADSSSVFPRVQSLPMPDAPFSAITVSIEWAKKLKEAGWQDKTVFAFDERFDYYELDDFYGLGAIYAPTAEEILRRLPPSMLHRNRRDMYRMMIRLTPRRHWRIGYATSKADWVFKEGIAAMQEDDTLANAAAAMWCHLADNNLLPQ